MKNPSLKRLLQVALLTVLLAAVSASASENLTVHFIDVGQGDSELLQFAGMNVLIDGGTQDMGPRVESYLRSHGATSLDLLVATHPHEDHIGGLITILNDIPIKQVLDSGQAHTSQNFERYLNIIDQKNIPFTVATRGQIVDLDPNLKIEVLSPPATPFPDDLNQNSIVLRIAYNNITFLFMGDAGDIAESSLLSSGYNLDSDILKVGHHGSATSSSTTFLNAVTPAISIIEVGSDNTYGHPTQQTLDALQNVGSTTYRTDTNGSIVVTTDGQNYSVSTEKQSWNTASTAPQSTLSVPASDSSTSAATTTVTTTSDGPFVGSKKSDKYHYPSCSAAKRIKSENLVTFASSADARAAGYSSCQKCNPP